MLLEEILITAKRSPDFKEQVIRACYDNDQAGKDYVVTVAHLLELNQTHAFFDEDQTVIIPQLVDYIKEADPERPEEPTVFVPYIEDRDLESLIEESVRPKMPKGVLGAEYDTATTECPLYSLNNQSQIFNTGTYANEAYAWENPVWVLDQEEVVEPVGEGIAGPPVYMRTNGYREFGGRISVNKVSDVEHWINGKLDFRILVYGANGAVLKDKKFDKVKRKEFDNKKWYNYNEFLFYWNTPNIGNYTIEKWEEVDGGSSASHTINIPPACTGCPSSSLTYPAQKLDDELGQIIVQFTDPDATEYPISHMKFTRRNIP